MQRISRRTATPWRWLGVPLAVLAVLATACAPTPSDPAAVPEQFCALFDEVGATPAALDAPVQVAPDVVAVADAASKVGDRCTEPGAQVELDDVLLAEDAAPTSPAGGVRAANASGTGAGSTDPELTGKRITAEEPVLDNVKLDSLSAWIDWQGITIRGSASVQLSGVTSVVGFTGTVYDLDNWSIQVSSSAFSLPGITSTPATFSGSLVVRNGEPTLRLNAAVTTAEIGDMTISGAQVALTASPSAGVSAAVSGSIEIGTSTISGSVAVRFDPVGTLVSVDAQVAAELRGWKVGGDEVRLDGQMTIEGNAEQTTVWFTGSGSIDGLQVNNANGQLTFSGNRTTFDGAVDAQVDGVSVRYRGQIIFDGRSVTTPFLELQAAGQITGVLPDGQLFEVDGQAELVTAAGGEVITVVTGDFRVGSLHATGQAQVRQVSPYTVLDVSVTADGAGLDGAHLAGQVILLDGHVGELTLDATVQSLQIATLTVSDVQVQIDGGFGQPLDLAASGNFRVGDMASGSLEASLRLGADGSLIALEAIADATLSLDGTRIEVAADAALDATTELVTVDATGVVNGDKVDAVVDGTLTVPIAQPASWYFRGTGSMSALGFLNFDPIGIAIRPGEFRTVGFAFDFYFLLMDRHVRAAIHFTPEGGFDHLSLRNSFGDFTGLIANALSDALGVAVRR